jgi:membrane associated rhomboid family serine protease
VTVSVGLLALAVSVMWWTGSSLHIDGLVMNVKVWERWELWRALTSTLPHLNFLHLAFNLYWLWIFGTLLERVYGHLRYAGIVLLLAFFSSMADFMLSHGGVGLSGVGYGLWGMLSVLAKRDPRFAGTIDSRTNQLFIGWFFLCIFLTISGAMPVGNVAHGAGAILGALLGLAASSTGKIRQLSRAGIAAAVLLVTAGSTLLWPWINLTDSAESEIERAGVEALHLVDNTKAIKLLETATHTRHAPARAWYNLGIAYQRLYRYPDSLAAYEHAARLPDATPDMQEAAEDLHPYLIRTKQ